MRSHIEPVHRRGFLAQSSLLASAAVGSGKFCFTFGLTSGFTLGAGSALAQPAPKKVMAVYPSRSAASWPLWIAKRAGLFERYGLDADLRFAIHPSGVAALVGGEAQFITYGLEQVIAAVVRDPSLVLTSSFLNKGAFSMVARSDIKTLRDLKGKRIGVGRVGDTPYFYTLELLNRNGIASTHVQWVGTGTDSTARAAMLANGQLDAVLLTAPSYYRLIDTPKFVELANLLDYPDIPITTAIVFKKSYVAANPGAPEAVIKATSEAIKRFYDDKTFAVATFKAFDPQSSVSDIERVYDRNMQGQTLDRVPMVRAASIKASAARMADDIPAARAFDYSTVVDNSAVVRLIKEGWFEKLFGPSVKAEQDAKLKAAL